MASTSAEDPPAATGHPRWWAIIAITTAIAPVSGRDSGMTVWPASPAKSPRTSGVVKRRASLVIGTGARSPSLTSLCGLLGMRSSGLRMVSMSRSACSTGHVISPR